MAMAYSNSFLMYFFLRALSRGRRHSSFNIIYYMSAEYREYLSAKGKKPTNSPTDGSDHQQDSFYAHEPDRSPPFNDLYDTSNLQRHLQHTESPHQFMSPQPSEDIVRDTVRYSPTSPLANRESSQLSSKHPYQESKGATLTNQTDKRYASRLLLAPPRPLNDSNTNHRPQPIHPQRTNSRTSIQQNQTIQLTTQYYVNNTSQPYIHPPNITNNHLQYSEQRIANQSNIPNGHFLNGAHYAQNHNQVPPPRTQFSPSRVNIRFLNNGHNNGNMNNINVNVRPPVNKTPPKIDQPISPRNSKNQIAANILLLSNDNQLTPRTLQSSTHPSNQYLSPRPITPKMQPLNTTPQQQIFLLQQQQQLQQLQQLQQIQKQQLMQQPPLMQQPQLTRSQQNISLSSKQYFQLQPSVLSVTSNFQVSRDEFEKMANQCRFWEQRCKEMENSEDRRDMIFLRKENVKLHQQILQLKNRERELIRNSQYIVANLVDKYRESTLKEYGLLLQRYHLQRRRDK